MKDDGDVQEVGVRDAERRACGVDPRSAEMMRRPVPTSHDFINRRNIYIKLLIRHLHQRQQYQLASARHAVQPSRFLGIILGEDDDPVTLFDHNLISLGR